MFVCQPRLFQLICSAVDPDNYFPPQQEQPDPMFSDNGLEVGDLWIDADQRLSAVNAYQLCRDETLAQAKTRRTVTYWITIPLDPRDPIMLDRQKVVDDLLAAKERRRVNRLLRDIPNFDSGSDFDYTDENEVILSPITEFTSGTDSN